MDNKLGETFNVFTTNDKIEAGNANEIYVQNNFNVFIRDEKTMVKPISSQQQRKVHSSNKTYRIRSSERHPALMQMQSAGRQIRQGGGPDGVEDSGREDPYKQTLLRQ